MDNHIFRSAIGGFNRQDVTDYIEKTRKEAAESARQLEEQLEKLRQELRETREELDSCRQERETLSGELEEMTGRFENAKTNWESQAVASETLRGDVAQRDQAVREMTVENQRLFRRVQELEEEVTGLRREKEKVAQLELEAHRRGEEVVAAAETRAEDLLRRAQEQAEDTVARACGEAGALRCQAREQILGAVEQYNAMVASFGSIAAHVSGELRRMDVTAAQLPICFDHVQGGLQAVLDKLEEQ